MFRSSAGGFEGDRGVVFPQSLFLSQRHEGRVVEQGDQHHYTSYLFLQRFVESEREFLNSLFLTNLSTLVLYGIPLSESLLVASSIFYITFFLARAYFYSSARVPHLRCNCHHGSRCFFRVFYHPLNRFLLCDRLNKMAQCAIIPDSSIITSNSPKCEEKGPHRTLLFSRTSPVNLLIVLKEYTN